MTLRTPRSRALAIALGLGALVVIALGVRHAPQLEEAPDEVPAPIVLEPEERAGSGGSSAIDEASPWLALAMGLALIYAMWRASKGDPLAQPLLGVLLFVALVLLMIDFTLIDTGQAPSETPIVESEEATGTTSGGRGPSLAWLLVVGVGLVGVLLALSWRHRTPAATDAEVDVAADVAAAGLESLESIADPRQAVIAAYARMEAELARAGIARADSQTSREYVAGVLEARAADAAPLRRLGALYERARFSRFPVTEVDREQAIAALRSITRVSA